MPTRRILELTVVTVLLMHPLVAMVRLWAAKTLGEAAPGGLAHGVAEVGSVVVG